MSKAQFKKALRSFRELFINDPEALDALAMLEDKLDDVVVNPMVESQESASGQFPIPVELIQNPDAFAIFSDGACRGNPGPGAWGIVAQDSKGSVLFEGSGVDVTTTNNRMELEGAIRAIEGIRDHFSEIGISDNAKVFLFSDSKYVVDGISKWVDGWKRRGWKKADKKTPENVELWKELDRLNMLMGSLSFRWVKGHAGHPQNEHCDQLANLALDSAGF